LDYWIIGLVDWWIGGTGVPSVALGVTPGAGGAKGGAWERGLMDLSICRFVDCGMVGWMGTTGGLFYVCSFLLIHG
jgi:hypothetical protein